MNNKVSVVIPAFNEEERLPSTLQEAVSFLESTHRDYEIIVVSDGSRDATNQIVQTAAQGNPRLKLLVNEQNQGKGFSIRKGILAAQGEQILFMDADNSTTVAEIEQLLPYLETAEVVIGSRAAAGARIIKHQSWLREKTGRMLNWFIQLLFLPGIKDTQCGFKLFKRGAARNIFRQARINRFVFDVEALYLAKKLGYKIKEVPITWTNSKPSRVSFWGDFFNIIIDLVRIKLTTTAAVCLFLLP